ncbi:MAG: enoyl-CoA hydratase/isomerase family protein [Burkholderiales bacterium]|nr:enoyl-CoA hydratase/isomerase family protein [Burkholderiales bacterium]
MIDLDLRAGVARLTLHAAPVNAIGPQWLAAANAVLDTLGGRDDWRVLHVRSDLRVFCAGADLDHMRRCFATDSGPDEMAELAAAMQRLFARIESLPQVALAEIGGAALGGGLELALACDLRMAGTQARLGLPEARLGLVPGAGGTQRLARIAGPATASRLILGAEVVDGALAAQLGIVQWTVPDDELAARAAELARTIAALPAAALAHCKSCLAAASDPARDGFALEIAASRTLYRNPETRALVDAFLARGSRTPTGAK